MYEYRYIEIRKPGRLHTLISVPDLAKLIVRWPVQAHGNDRDRERDRDRDRDTMIVFRVERGEHLNSSDREGLGTGNTGLDLSANARFPGAARLEIEAGIVVRLLHRIAAESATESAFGRDYRDEAAGGSARVWVNLQLCAQRLKTSRPSRASRPRPCQTS